ncbi:MAG TPA: NAD(P)/FAD-dependent oxidoreductase [Acidobacteriota bacterium]|jgi:flavin-dependent dehydrogenase
MRVGIVGGGPAGSHAAALLSQTGLEVTLFERKRGREKACGGGFTSRALKACRLAESGVPRSCIKELELISGKRRVILPLEAPFQIFARACSDTYLLEQAEAQGVTIEDRNVTDIRACGSGWEIKAGDVSFRFDWLIGADGSHSRVRAACSRPFELADLSMTFGYYAPGEFHPQRAIVEFLPRGFQGYLWSFPRPDHSSVGVIHTADHPITKTLRLHADNFLRRYYDMLPPGKERIYAATVPTLRQSTLRTNRCSGSNWALIGDAGGFVDAITGEGIYFALRAAQLLSQLAHEKTLEGFDALWRQDFGEELAASSRLKTAFYSGARWKWSYAELLLPFTERSATVRKIENEYIAGSQGYAGLKQRILRSAPRILWETAMTFLTPRA